MYSVKPGMTQFVLVCTGAYKTKVYQYMVYQYIPVCSSMYQYWQYIFEKAK